MRIGPRIKLNHPPPPCDDDSTNDDVNVSVNSGLNTPQKECNILNEIIDIIRDQKWSANVCVKILSFVLSLVT